ncbi:MAG: ABC transporter permease [Planctomycetes bacterium]|nr:ABC transporter permease [Planctomycetota bacterium]
MFQQLITVGRNTFIESIRQPIFVVLIIVGIIALTLNPMLAAYTLEGDNDNKLMIDMGISTLFMIGLFLAAFTATGVLNREIENKTVLTVVSKPVSRPVFVLGKFAGVAAALGLAFWCLSLVLLFTVRHHVIQTTSSDFDEPVITFALLGLALTLGVATVGNYLYNWVFTSSFSLCFFLFETAAWVLIMHISREWQFQSPLTDINSQLLYGLVLLFQALLIITAVAIAASTRLGQVMTLVTCFLVFALGLINDYFLGGLAGRALWAEVFYRVIPNFQIFWPTDALTQGHDFTHTYILWVSGYCGLFVTAILALAVGLFQTREVG